MHPHRRNYPLFLYQCRATKADFPDWERFFVDNFVDNSVDRWGKLPFWVDKLGKSPIFDRVPSKLCSTLGKTYPHIPKA